MTNKSLIEIQTELAEEYQHRFQATTTPDLSGIEVLIEKHLDWLEKYKFKDGLCLFARTTGKNVLLNSCNRYKFRYDERPVFPYINVVVINAITIARKHVWGHEVSRMQTILCEYNLFTTN